MAIATATEAIELLGGLPADGEELIARCAPYEDLVRRLGAIRRDVSVVIPIYNAPEALDRCLRTLEAHARGAEVVLVDDRSPDPRIGRLTREFAATWPRTVIVVAEQNGGFVRSVNTGILAADPENDVVLLNSDTEVTPGWLRKLALAAASVPDVATVSPLSNAAGIYSVPRAHADEPPPPGWDADMCARALEDVSERVYEETPATSGFCLYIRRDAVDRIGVFDELLIRRGYGEENDFCARAAGVGMTHLIDDATFVFHRRAESFMGWKALLKSQNSRVLKALHPGHIDDQRTWEAASELDVVRGRYNRFVEAIGTPPTAERRSWVGPTRTRLALAEGPTDGAWRPGERLVTVAFSDREAHVSLFGARRIDARCPIEQRLALVSWLIARFSVDVVESARLLTAEQQAVLRAAAPTSGGWTLR